MDCVRDSQPRFRPIIAEAVLPRSVPQAFPALLQSLLWLGLCVPGPSAAATVEVAPTSEYVAYDRDTVPRGPYASEEEALNVVLPTYVQQYYFPSTGETRYYDYPSVTDQSPYAKTINGNWSWHRSVYMRQLVRSVFDNGNYLEYFIATSTASLLSYKCPSGFWFKEDFATWELGQPGPTCVGEEACPVGALTPYSPDPYPLNTDSLTQRTTDAISCLETCSGQSRTTFLSSAYRPVEYQNHIREVWNKWKELEPNHSPACTALRTQVMNEYFNVHHLDASTIRPSNNSCHTAGGAGTCFDVNRSFTETVDFCSTQCNVYRPWPSLPPPRKSDPVHVVPY